MNNGSPSTFSRCANFWKCDRDPELAFQKLRASGHLPPSTFPTVDVIVVLWHSVPYLSNLFKGLVQLDYPKDTICVHIVDNSPGDGSLAEARRLIELCGDRLPQIEIYEPGANLGFSGGHNFAIKKSIERGHDYVYLLNYDAEFEPSALSEAIAAAESDPLIGSVQSLLVLQQNPEEINSYGNVIHYLGFGYCGGYHGKRSEVSPEIKNIAYASGAGVLFKNDVLKKTGLLDETLFAYHEDLDLGWRIMLSGYKNVLAPKSVVRHHYEFSRSITKWYWMERNRMLVLLKNYHWLTLIALTPLLLVADLAIIAMSLKGGWWKEKLRANWQLFKPQTWSYIRRGRVDIKKIRQIPDRFILEHFTPVIAYQEFENDLVKNVANPFLKLGFLILKIIVRW